MSYRILIIRTLLAVAPGAIAYGIGAFTSWELDVSQWHPVGRYAVASFAVFFGGYLAFIPRGLIEGRRP